MSRSSSTKSDAGVQCTAREINQATKNDPWNVRLGGFVISETFIEAASQAKELKPNPKAAPKKKLGTQNANIKAATDAPPEPATKRRGLQPNACPSPPPHTRPTRPVWGSTSGPHRGRG